MNEQFRISSAVIALGWLARRLLIDDRGAHALVQVVFTFTLPALVLVTFDGARLDPALAILPAIAIVHGLLMAGLGGLLWRGRPLRERGQRALLLPAFNVGLFAYPLVEAGLGRDALRPLAMFDVGVAFCSFGIAFAVASHYAREGARVDLRQAARELARSVPFVVYAVTVTAAILGLRFPRPVVQVAGVLARANMPLALLILGLYLRFEGARAQWRSVAEVLAVRVGVGLAVGVPLWLWLPLDPTLRAVILAGLLLPPPLMAISHGLRFGYDPRRIGLTLNVANVASYGLLWILFSAIR